MGGFEGLIACRLRREEQDKARFAPGAGLHLSIPRVRCRFQGKGAV